MLALYLVIVGLHVGLALLYWSIKRSPLAPLREAAISSRIAELTAGRYRVTGRVVPVRTTASEIDGAPCVYLERARYASIGAGVFRQVAHAHAAHSFYLDDGSGRLLIDPATTLIDCSSATGDGGLLVERRLRAGEEIEIVGQFRTTDGLSLADLEGEGPYRAAPSPFEAGPDEVGPPRISYRTLEGMERTRIDEATSFIRGAGALVIAMSLCFGAFALWMQLHPVVLAEPVAEE